MDVKYDNNLVSKVSDFLQDYMKKNNIDKMSADECAFILAKHNILSNKIGPKIGFNFRQMLRNGRDGIIDLVKGTYQEKPNKKWIIKREIKNTIKIGDMVVFINDNKYHKLYDSDFFIVERIMKHKQRKNGIAFRIVNPKNNRYVVNASRSQLKKI